MANALQWMEDELARLRAQAQYRLLVDSAPADDGWIIRCGKRMLNLASNHYLGLEQVLDGEVVDRWHRHAAQIGGNVSTGATASRLIVGSDPVYAAFEEEFAAFKGTGSCLLFGSGYLANVGIISALAGRGDLIFSDRLNHASIVDGAILSRAELVRYRHRDVGHLDELLQRADPAKKKLIVTDAVFSMDGTLAPLAELVRLKERYGAMLMVDEAHSGGIYGSSGEGLTHALGLTRQVEVQMGTFSKAYGAYGAYAAGPEVLKEYLVNKARSLIYTTALPPALVLAVRDNWQRARTEGWRRAALLGKAERFRRGLQALGFATGESQCQIVPLIVGDNARAVALSALLQEAGVAAVAIRPPTVPERTARIRFTLMATHRDEDLDWALGVIGAAGRQLGLLTAV